MRVAFCGLGNMGRPMAARLLGAGHRVTVWNRTAGRADDPRLRARLGEAAESWLHDAQDEGLGDRDQAEVVDVIRRSGAGQVAEDRGSGGGRASPSSRHERGPAG
jgi:predicted dinucleotide-binding enzyme